MRTLHVQQWQQSTNFCKLERKVCLLRTVRQLEIPASPLQQHPAPEKITRTSEETALHASQHDLESSLATVKWLVQLQRAVKKSVS